MRLAVLSAIVVALAGPQWPRIGETARVVVVVDRSASVDPASRDAALAQLPALADRWDVGVVAFDGVPQVVVAPGQAWPEALELGAGLPGSDVDAALSLAASLAPDHVVVLADERVQVNGTAGVDVVVLDTLSPALGDLTAPGQARLEQTFDVSVHVHEPGALRVTAQDEVVFEGQVEPGLWQGTHAFTEAQQGAVALNATLNGVERRRVVRVQEPARVLVIAPELDQVQPLVAALQAEALEVVFYTAAEAHGAGLQPERYDVVVLANVPAISDVDGPTTLAPGFLEDLRRAVSDGTGLVTYGGPQSYDLGGWDESELGAVLPVEPNPQDGRLGAPLTLVMSLDRSGSMSRSVGHLTKMDLANQGAVAAMNLLRPEDWVAVAAVDTESHWRVPLIEPLYNPVTKDRILSIYADGSGIYVYTALEDARAVLAESDTPLKHVILFSDAADSVEKSKNGHQAVALARDMWREGTTLSVIGIGRSGDKDTAFLRSLANHGGGRFYLTSDARQLKGLFIQETRRLVGSALRERAYRPREVHDHEILDDIRLNRSPLQRGYVKVRPRPTAQVLAESAMGDPWLVTWQYGLGQVVCVTSDAGPIWGARFTQWDQYAQLQTQITRYAVRDQVGHAAVELTPAGALTQIRILRRDGDDVALDDDLTATLDQAPVALRLVAPGLWQGELDLDADTPSTLVLRQGDGRVVLERGVLRPAADEFGPVRPDLREMGPTLASLDQAEITPRPAPDRRPAWPGFALLALVLLPLDALLRRPVRVI
jgi:uncharacterized membrane protein